MKKLLMSLAAICLAVAQIAAQKPEFVKGNKVINLGLGIGSGLLGETYYHTSVPPISASFEIGVADHILEKGEIGVGGYLGATSYKYEYSNKGWKNSEVIIGARGNFHYPLIKKLDSYSGLMLGYGIIGIKYFGGYGDDDYTGFSNGIRWAWFVGGRYYLSETFAAMLELGYGISYLNLGLAYKF